MDQTNLCNNPKIILSLANNNNKVLGTDLSKKNSNLDNIINLTEDEKRPLNSNAAQKVISLWILI